MRILAAVRARTRAPAAGTGGGAQRGGAREEGGGGWRPRRKGGGPAGAETLRIGTGPALCVVRSGPVRCEEAAERSDETARAAGA